VHMWVQNNYSPASDSTYYYFNGRGNETPSDLEHDGQVGQLRDEGDRAAPRVMVAGPRPVLFLGFRAAVALGRTASAAVQGMMPSSA